MIEFYSRSASMLSAILRAGEFIPADYESSLHAHYSHHTVNLLFVYGGGRGRLFLNCCKTLQV